MDSELKTLEANTLEWLKIQADLMPVTETFCTTPLAVGRECGLWPDHNEPCEWAAQIYAFTPGAPMARLHRQIKWLITLMEEHFSSAGTRCELTTFGKECSLSKACKDLRDGATRMGYPWPE